MPLAIQLQENVNANRDGLVKIAHNKLVPRDTTEKIVKTYAIAKLKIPNCEFFFLFLFLFPKKRR